jgi:hypothetical protein
MSDVTMSLNSIWSLQNKIRLALLILRMALLSIMSLITVGIDIGMILLGANERCQETLKIKTLKISFYKKELEEGLR